MILRLGSLLSCALACTGCFEQTVYSGRPPAHVAPAHDQRWSHAFVFGLLEAEGPYDLDRLCPHGWAELHTESDLLTGATSLLSFGIYTPEYVTIVCAAAPANAAPPTLDPLPP